MTYYTRRNVHVDRIASAWLIKRFVDPDGEFAFVEEGEQLEGAIPFDISGAELGHHGSDCTFETIIRRYRLREPGLHELATIIHGADILTDSDQALESPGIDLMFRAIRRSEASDRAALELGFRLLDAILAILAERPGLAMER